MAAPAFSSDPILLSLILAGVLTRRCVWLPLVGRALIHDEGPAKADIAVVLAGDHSGNRILKAAELVAQGYVPAVLVSGPPVCTASTRAMLAIRFAVAAGLSAPSGSSPLPHSALSTREEARRHAGGAAAAAISTAFCWSPATTTPPAPRRIYPRDASGSWAAARQCAWWRRRTSTSTPDAWWQQPRGPQDRLHGVVQNVRHGCWGSEPCGSRSPPSANISGATGAGMALGGVCLVLKDLAQALQPLMIRGAVDALRAAAARRFVRFAAVPASASRC